MEDRVVPAVTLTYGEQFSWPGLLGIPGSPTDSSYIRDVRDQAIDSAGNRYVLAEHIDTAVASENFAFLARFTTAGQLDTNFGTGGIRTFLGNPWGYALEIDASDNIYVAIGAEYSGPSTILKVDASGTTLQQYSNAGTDQGRILDLDTDIGGNLYYGTHNSLVKLESPATGSSLVNKGEYRWGGGGVGLDVSDSGSQIYVMGTFGGTFDFDPAHTHADSSDILSIGTRRDPWTATFVLELSQDSPDVLAFEWVGQYGADGNIDKPYDVAVNGDGIYLLGDPIGMVDLDPGAAEYRMIEDEEQYLLKLTNAPGTGDHNTFEWAKGIVGGRVFPPLPGRPARLRRRRQRLRRGSHRGDHARPGCRDQLRGKRRRADRPSDGQFGR